MIIIDEKTGNQLDIKIVFSFIDRKSQKKYIAFDFQKNIFNNNVFLNDLNLLEVIAEKSNTIYVSEIADEDWESVKSTLQNEILSNI